MEIKSYRELEQLLRKFHSWSDESIYDFNGIFHLWLALLDNLQENALDAELNDIAETMTPSQREFLSKLLHIANSPTDET